MENNQRITIGAKERIIFKNALKEKVVARIDTGARTSSVHCYKLWVDKQFGKKTLNFILINERATPLKTTDYKKRYVKSSNGEVDIRYSVLLEVKMGEETFTAEFTLAQRDNMRHSVLLGRNVLAGKYIVDVEKKFLLKRIKTNII